MKAPQAAPDVGLSLRGQRRLLRRSTGPEFRRSRSPRLPVLALFGLALLPGVWTGPAASFAGEQYWPQWRGPLQNGVAPQADPPTEWSETKNVKWKVKIPGEGAATPIVWEDQVFIQTAIATKKKAETPAGNSASPSIADAPADNPSGPRRGGRGMGSEKPTEYFQFVLLCLDRQTGKTLWQQIAREEVPHEGHKDPEGSFAAPSPVTDGQHVFAYFGSRGLYCYDMTGKLQWSQDFGDLRIARGFGEGSSPALYQDNILVNWDNEGDSFIIALDKKTGKTIWKTSRDERTSWCTPLVVEQKGVAQVVTSASGRIRAYDLATGKLAWECGGMTRNVIPSPVAGHEMVYCTSGFQGNALLAIRLGRSGDLTGSDAIAWSHNKSTPYVPSPLLYGDKLYFHAGNNGILSCFDAQSGRALIDAERIEDLPGVFASPVGAAGRVYLVGRNGSVVVIKQSDKLDLLATNRLEEKFDASPAIAGKDLFLRGHEHLYCLAEK